METETSFIVILSNKIKKKGYPCLTEKLNFLCIYLQIKLICASFKIFANLFLVSNS